MKDEIKREFMIRPERIRNDDVSHGSFQVN